MATTLTVMQISGMKEALDRKEKHDLRNKLGLSILGEIDGFIKELREIIVDFILTPLPSSTADQIEVQRERAWAEFFGRPVVYNNHFHLIVEEQKLQKPKKPRHNKKLLYNH